MKKLLGLVLVMLVVTASTSFATVFIPGVTVESNIPGREMAGYEAGGIVDGTGWSWESETHIAEDSAYGELVIGGFELLEGSCFGWAAGPYYLLDDGVTWEPFELYLEFDLGYVYDVNEIHIWNGAQTHPAALGRGFGKVDIAYSNDGGATYTNAYTGLSLQDARALYSPLAHGDQFTVSDIVGMNNVAADYIRIYAYPDYDGGTFNGDTTPCDAWDHGDYRYAMSEVKFVTNNGEEVEPFVPEEDALTRRQVTVTASSEAFAGNAQSVVDHYGISDPMLFEHTGNQYGVGMWGSLAGGGGYLNPAATGLPASRSTGRAWMKFDFDNAYDLGFMSVWNCNQSPALNRGLRKVYIDYTADGGTTWNTLMGDPDEFHVLRPGTGSDTVPGDHIDFGGVTADSVVITALENDGNWGDPEYWSLSEVRFGLYGTVWGAPIYPSQDVLTHDKITVTIPSVDTQDGAVVRLVDNTGLGDNFRHIAEKYGYGMLVCDPNAPSAAVPGQTVTGAMWYRFDFDQVYNLGKMYVWNYNQIATVDLTDRGLKNVTVEYTSDGVNWNTLGTDQIAQALAETQSTFDPNEIDFAGAAASSVVITASDNWGDPDLYGLSQVQFGLDGTVFGYDISHLSAFVSQWLDDGIVGEDCLLPPGWDLNGDCYVNFYDFAVVAERWLLNN